MKCSATRNALMLAGLAALAAAAMGQPPFDCGSDGSDGALVIDPGTGDPVEIIFDPASYMPPLDADGDGVYHFTSVSIPSNVTLRLRALECGAQPVAWLSTGDIEIDGTLSLKGGTGSSHGPGLQEMSMPGPGGYPGGGGHMNTPEVNAQPGLGPEGGIAGNQSTALGGRHKNYGNLYMRPLTGGSGGGGSTVNGGSGGGAGGGAILLASSTEISIPGRVDVNGGDAGSPTTSVYRGGSGGGGSIHVVAPRVSGSGILSSLPGPFGYNVGSEAQGRVRLEAYEDDFTGQINAREYRRVTLSPTTYQEPDFTNWPKVRVASVGGMAVPSRPLGSFLAPDVTIDTDSPVDIVVNAENVPPGTTVTVLLYSESDGTFTATSGPLAGTEASSTATATTALPAGFTRGYAFADWTAD